MRLTKDLQINDAESTAKVRAITSKWKNQNNCILGSRCAKEDG